MNRRDRERQYARRKQHMESWSHEDRSMPMPYWPSRRTPLARCRRLLRSWLRRPEAMAHERPDMDSLRAASHKTKTMIHFVNHENIAFIDCETTGLDFDRHTVWQIGLIVNNEEYLWKISLAPEELAQADSGALRVNGFYVDHNPSQWRPHSSSGNTGNVDIGYKRDFALYLATIINNRHLVGMSVSFDDKMIGQFMRSQGVPPAWHYHLIDVEALAAGKLGIQPPWNSKELSMAVGIDPENFDRHNALGDAKWARAVYMAVYNG